MMPRAIIVILFLSTLYSCNKDLKTIEFEQIAFEGVAPIRCLESFGDTIIAAGGEREGAGFMSISDRHVMDFQVIKSDFKSPVYSIEKYVDRYWFGLDKALLNQSFNLNLVEPYYFNQNDWVGSLYQHPVRRMDRVGSELFAIAGGQLTKGVIYQSSDSSKSWNPIEFDHELRALCTIGDSNDWKAWVGGNGVLLTKSTNDSAWRRIDLEDVFIVELVFENRDLGWMAAFDGRVFKTNDGGENWSEVHKPKGKRYTNGMRHHNGHFIMVAQDGLFAHSTNGESWRWYDLETNQDLLSAWIGDDEVILGTDAGEVYRVSISKL